MAITVPESLVGHPLLGRAVQLGTLASESAALELVELVTDGFLDGAASIRELALRDEAVDALQELFFDGDGNLGGRHGERSLV
jgi:hypothetical protein